MSDDFSEPVKKALAGRVGYLCSNPACRALTSGPQDDPAKFINVGVAAHITAASPGGPRYDASLSPEQRRAPANGIWLCQICAKLIDNDVPRFPAELLTKWKSDAETDARSRVGKSTASAIGDLLMDVSIITESPGLWRHGEENIVRYGLDRKDGLIRIEANLGYLTLFKNGGSIGPMEYVNSPSYCPFKWDFPILDFKVLNNRNSALFLTEIVFDIEESHRDAIALMTIKRDTQQRFAGLLLLVNEGGCDLRNVDVRFHLFPGLVPAPANAVSPFPHSISLPLLEDHAELDVTGAFRKEGTDIDGLILLAQGRWEENGFIAPKSDGQEETISEQELDARYKKHFGPFATEVGTLVGEISFESATGSSDRSAVKFSAPVYLANMNRRGILRPPSYKYDCTFDVEGRNYQKRVQISHSLEAGESDRFTVQIAALESSFHRFRATLRDISGSVWESVPVEMTCFIPRSRRSILTSKLASAEGSSSTERTPCYPGK